MHLTMLMDTSLALRDIFSDVRHRQVDFKDESSIHLSSIPIRGNTTKYVYLDLYFSSIHYEDQCVLLLGKYYKIMEDHKNDIEMQLSFNFTNFII